MLWRRTDITVKDIQRQQAVCPSVCVSVAALHLKVADVLEDKRVVDVDGLADLVVHCVDVGLVHGHALLGQG